MLWICAAAACAAGLAGYAVTLAVLPSVFTGVLAACTVMIASYAAKFLRFSEPIRGVMSLYGLIDSFENTKMQENIRRYADETRDGLGSIIQDLKNGEVILDERQYERLLNIVFQTKIPYYAIDVSLPSEYQARYPTYLAAHERSLTDSGRGYRIIAREADEIERDSREPKFSKFWEWHDDHGVALYHISHTRLEMIVRKHGIIPGECTLGIAMWGGEFAILFAESERRRKHLRIVPRSDERFARIQKIYAQVNAECEIMRRTASPRIMKKPLIAGWRDYINMEKRWSTMRPFLYNFFDRYRRERRIVTDMAAGIGVEYFHMMEDGYLMHCNEVQDELVEEGVRYGKDCGYAIQYCPTKHTWLDLVKMGLAGMYGGLFATGNSIRMVGGRQAQREIIGQFYDLLQEGGTIIIDERNHERLLKYSDEINRCGAEKRNREVFARLSRVTHEVDNPLYHGSAIRSIPYGMNAERTVITFCYYVDDKVADLAGAESHKIQDWMFYHYDRLEDMLGDAGFVDIQKYADYDLSRKLDLYGEDDEAAMFVYVATKP